MIFVKHLYAIKSHLNGYKRSLRMILQEEISFKTVEGEEIIKEMQLNRGD